MSNNFTQFVSSYVFSGYKNVVMEGDSRQRAPNHSHPMRPMLLSLGLD